MSLNIFRLGISQKFSIPLGLCSGHDVDFKTWRIRSGIGPTPRAWRTYAHEFCSDITSSCFGACRFAIRLNSNDKADRQEKPTRAIKTI